MTTMMTAMMFGCFKKYFSHLPLSWRFAAITKLYKWKGITSSRGYEELPKNVSNGLLCMCAGKLCRAHDLCFSCLLLSPFFLPIKCELTAICCVNDC